MKSKQKTNLKLSRGTIVTAAIAIADKDGLSHLSMRKLAHTLDIEAMSLYYHFKNKGDLIAEMVDAVVPAIDDVGHFSTWQEALLKRADVMRSTLIAHPWAAHEFVSGINVGPNMLRYVDTTIGYLFNAGFSYKLADYVWHTVDSYIYGFNLQFQNFPLDPSEYKVAATQFLPLIPKETHPYMHGMSLTIIDGTHDGIQDFHFGIELILESLNKLLIKEKKEK